MTPRILLVEDDPIDQKFIRQALTASSSNLQVDLARDGAEALNYLRGNGPPKVILIDLNMPRMNGQELLSALKGDQKLRKIPAIVLSTTDDMKTITECYERHANAYLVKPASPAGYRRVAGRLKEFWLDEVQLPH